MINKSDLVDIYRTQNPTTAESAFFSWCTWNIYRNQPYPGPLSKSEQISKCWNHTEYVFRPQCFYAIN